MQASIIKSTVGAFLLFLGALLCLSHCWEEEPQKLQAQCAHQNSRTLPSNTSQDDLNAHLPETKEALMHAAAFKGVVLL